MTKLTLKLSEDGWSHLLLALEDYADNLDRRITEERENGYEFGAQELEQASEVVRELIQQVDR